MPSVKILIVEDEKISAMAIRRMLAELGYTVTGTAMSGEEAIRKASEIQPDLVLMDIKLDGLLDGIETAETLNRLYNIPVVYITAYEDEQIFQRAKLTAPFGYMIKPFDERLLRINIEIAIYKHQVEEKLKEKALEEEKETYRLNLEAIFRSLEEGIISVDRDLNIIHLNPAIENTCGFSVEDKGKPFRIFRKNSCNKCIEILEETIIKKQPVKIDRFECEQNNSSKKIFSISSVPLIDEKGLFSGAILVIRDKTHIDVLEKELEERRSFYNIIGKSKEIQKIYDLIEILSDVQSTVLITGESGTGKELVAEALHYKGIRSNKPLVKLNCTALSESLLESELFGHVKGAFTGALKDKIGR
ncbi:MAG: sigma 54-interacting transcriptional regulator, partial [Candidatus Eremiobacterota bacterium]